MEAQDFTRKREAYVSSRAAVAPLVSTPRVLDFLRVIQQTHRRVQRNRFCLPRPRAGRADSYPEMTGGQNGIRFFTN